MPTVGAKNKYVTIEQVTVNRDSFGEPVKSYSTLLSCWAHIQPLRGSEVFEAKQVMATVSHRIRINYDPRLKTVTPKCRIKLSNDDTPETFRYFDILALMNVNEMNYEYELLASEVIDG